MPTAITPTETAAEISSRIDRLRAPKRLKGYWRKQLALSAVNGDFEGVQRLLDAADRSFGR